MYRAQFLQKYPLLDTSLLDAYIVHIETTPVAAKDTYGEHHHILPISIFPELRNESWNRKRLSAQDHFIAHYWLWRLFPIGELAQAWHLMKGRKGIDDLLDEYAEHYALAKQHASTWIASQRRGKSQRGTGWHHSEETKKKIKEANTGKVHNEESRRKISITGRGRVVSEETRKKISDTTTGRIRGPHSEETRLKMSLSHKGVPTGPRLRSKPSPLKGRPSPLRGRHLSEETKLKLSEAHKLRRLGITKPNTVIKCPYCGTLNRSDARQCIECPTSFV